jgi:hypothetical protein
VAGPGGRAWVFMDGNGRVRARNKGGVEVGARGHQESAAGATIPAVMAGAAREARLLLRSEGIVEADKVGPRAGEVRADERGSVHQ